MKKTQTWERITNEFKSSGPLYPRDTDCLKGFYDNQKKLLRKTIVTERRDLYQTGGEMPSKQVKKEPNEELILFIVNQKAIYGLNNPLDGDSLTGPNTLTESSLQKSPLAEVQYDDNDNIEIVYESDLEELELDEEARKYIESENKIWKKDKSVNLQIPCSTSSKDQDESTGLKKGTDNTPNRKTGRRRPAVNVKALTSFDLAEKYYRLLAMRLEVANLLKSKLQRYIDEDAIKHQKQITLLDIQIEGGKEKYKKK